MDTSTEHVGTAAADTVDVETIRRTVHQATAPRLTIPTNERIDQLVERLHGHLALLLEEDVLNPPKAAAGEDPGDLPDMRVEAANLLNSVPTRDKGRIVRWGYVEILGCAVKGLLREYEERSQ